MSYIVILMSFTAIFPSIGYGVLDRIIEHAGSWESTKKQKIW
jgi:hypothetical protein